MDSGHKTFSDPKILMDDFGKWSKTICGARSVRNYMLISSIFMVVNANNVSWGTFILRGSTHNDLLSTPLKVKTSLLVSQECTSWFTNNSCTWFTPFNVGWVFFSKNSNPLSINQDALIPFFNLMIETSMSRIILKLINKIIDRHEGIINSNYFNRFVILEYWSENETTNSSKTVNTKTKRHF